MDTERYLVALFLAMKPWNSQFNRRDRNLEAKVSSSSSFSLALQESPESLAFSADTRLKQLYKEQKAVAPPYV
jgi:hypothetical protein